MYSIVITKGKNKKQEIISFSYIHLYYGTSIEKSWNPTVYIRLAIK